MSTALMRNSERSAMKRCPQRWSWAFEENLKPKHTNTKLWMGTGVHLALAEWYLPGTKRGPHPVKTWEAYCKGEEGERASGVWESEEGEWHDAVEMGIEMLEEYVNHYGKDKDWDVIATEQVFQIAIKNGEFGIKGNKILAHLVGTIDGVYRDKRTGDCWLMEHKTAAAISTKHLALDPQASTYHYVATRILRKLGLIGPKDEIVGVMYNFLLKYASPSDDRPQDEQGRYRNKPKKADFAAAAESNGLVLPPKMLLADYDTWFTEQGITVYGEVSARQPKPVAERFHREPVYKTVTERRNTGRHIVNDAATREFYRSGNLPLLKNPTKDCSWDCDFYEMCMLQEAGGDWEEYRDIAMTTWDPYADHEIERKSS